MKRTLPNFELMRTFYPGNGFTAEQLKLLIGGNVNSPDITNTCVVRLSRPLNFLGHLIPPWTKPFRTRTGADKRWYGLRVKEFWKYLINTYGEPTLTAKQPISSSTFEGMRGIIGFRVSSFKDASGHFTLWDGNRLLYGGEEHDYFAIADEAALWQAGTSRVTMPGA